MRTVLWQDPSDAGAERCELDDGPQGATVRGTALLAVEGAPCEVRYAVRVDARWHTRGVEVQRAGPDADLGVEVESDGAGRWLVDGEHRADLDGCIDIDLEFSPATNTLPIRRLGLAVGEERELSAAWLRFPDLRVERADQRYRRLAGDRYRFAISGFSADLTVDGHGLVARYGEFWRQVASR